MLFEHLGIHLPKKILASEESIDDIGIIKLTNAQMSQPADSKTSIEHAV